MTRILAGTALVLALGFAGLTASFAQTAGSTASTQASYPPIDDGRLRAHIKTLSDDFFEGRSPGTRGDDMATTYVAGAMAALGLEPAGDKGTWFQNFQLNRFSTAARGTFSVEDEIWQQGKDVMMISRRADGSSYNLTDAPLVFAGYGVRAPEKNWDDYAGVDWHGKIAIVLINDPDFEAAPGEPVAGQFGGKAMQWYGRWVYKYEAAAKAGAAGVLIVHEDAPAAYGWGVVRNSNGTRFDFVRPDAGASLVAIEGWMQRDVAVELFRKSGLDFDVLKKAARTPGFKPVALNQTATIDISVSRETIATRNVVGVLKGASRPDETVLIGAHHDHLGIREPINGDAIYNGAMDNASGMAGVLEIARTIANGPRPARSIVFASWAAEEQGLLGSDYYVNNPSFPLEKTAAAFTLDMLAHRGATTEMEFPGAGKTSLDASMKAILAAQGRSFTPDRNPQFGLFYRSDHFPFARAGVPAMFPTSGTTLVKGGVAAGEAATKEWFDKRYHKPQDEYDPAFDFAGALMDLTATRSLMLEIANSRTWPQWTKGDEFEALRKASDTARR
ncbi:bacterial leucyl aminopeptidase [Candidatus Phycosocius bacilliformis]|uniref:Bacterial leucyl aminopeptidase n=1 Tax=Candidatus Phycosocius bacilliformis TaxID=1445552 RepID=A0A2P2EC70_9PROT|nr:M28 family peptidase [Candidatus Phycosocius bacilliformis]GBF58659.1 bacterial leucyl aminopeptidase [Candidatus Phycosocius bacilliformis]